mgnify:CR=1 FL=1
MIKLFLRTNLGKILAKIGLRFYTILKLLIPVWLMSLIFPFEITMDVRGLLLMSLLLLLSRILVAVGVSLYYAFGIGKIQIPEYLMEFVDDAEPIIEEIIQERVRNSI